MHWEQSQFVKAVKAAFPDHFENVRVLEVGAYDVNGSVRPFFAATHYVGLDLIEGPGVDVVCSGHEFRSPERFDTVISTECFEHNPFYLETFRNMIRHARDGGMVLFTCASEGRPEHGTPRAEPASSPGTVSTGSDYYRNLTAADFAAADPEKAFSDYRFLGNVVAHDLYFVGLTPCPAGAALETVADTARRLDAVSQVCAAVERVCAEADAAFELMRAGRHDEAVAQMQRTLRHAQPAVREYVLARQGWLLKQIKRDAEAEIAVREALTLSNAADLHWQLGTILQSLGRSAEALDAARRAAARAPANAVFAYFLGAVLRSQKRLDEAESALQRALALDATLAAAYEQLVLLRAGQRRWDEAVAAVRRAVALGPDESRFRALLEWVVGQQAGGKQ